MADMNWSLFLACYGAVTGTIGVAICLFNYLRDRVHLKIRYEEFQPNKKTGEIGVRFKIVNKGRRPISIMKTGIRRKDGHDFVFYRNKLILDEKTPIEEFNITEWVNSKRDIDFFWTEDGAGKIYKLYLTPFFIRVYEKILRKWKNG